MKLNDRGFIGLFVLAQALWAGSYIVGHFVVMELNPFATVQLRYSIAAIAMAPLLFTMFWKDRPDFRDRKWWTHTLTVTMIAGVIYQVLFFASLQYISPTTTALIYALNPFFTAFGEIVLFKQRRPMRFYIGFVIAFSGALWVISARGGQIDFRHLGIGELLAFSATLMWTAFTLYTKATRKPDWNPIWITGAQYLFTGIILFPIVFFMQGSYSLNAISGSTWMGMLYLAVLSTAFAHTMYYTSVQRLGAAISATFTYLVPSFTAVFEYVFLRSHFTLDMAVGTLLVVSGLVLGIVTRRKNSLR